MIQPLQNHQISEYHSWYHPPKDNETELLGCSQTIILAEDDDLLREQFMMHLTSRGFDVRCVENGVQAWKLLRETPFALLITDHEMPGLLGLELVRRMRSESYFQPVILISSNVPWNYSDMYELLSPGAAIEKPFKIDELVEVICGMGAFRSIRR